MAGHHNETIVRQLEAESCAYGDMLILPLEAENMNAVSDALTHDRLSRCCALMREWV